MRATIDVECLTVTHIFLLWAKDLISLADPAALGGRARERTCLVSNYPPPHQNVFMV